jgi:heptosyltransferase-2
VKRVCLFPTSLSSPLAGLMSGAAERTGFGPRPGRKRDAAAGLLVNRRIRRGPLGSRHLEDEYLDLVGGTVASAGPRRVLPLARSQSKSIPGLQPGMPYAVLSPGARYGPAKRWGVERFAVAARRITRPQNLTPVLVGEHDDADVCARLAAAIGPEAIDLAGKTDLAELASILSGAAGVVANDSGTAHLAASLGRPTVVIFGSTEPAWTAPRGEHVAVVRIKLRCSPCFRRSCSLDDAYACLRLVEPDAVVEAFASVAGREAA